MSPDDVRPRLSIDAAARIARETEAGGLEAEHFLHAFYRNVAPADIERRSAADLAASALSLWRFAAIRKQGAPRIRVLPGGEAPGAEQRAVVQIVNDDMPFLVDSVSAALTAEGSAVHLVIHPVMPVQRDGDGARTDSGSGVAFAESYMHIELADRPDADRRQAIGQRLAAVLADVRAVVADWPAMRAIASRIADDLGRAALPVPLAEAAEVSAFLHWLTEGNFTFLGYREYRLQGDSIAIVPEVGRGLLRNDDVLVFDGLRTVIGTSPGVRAFLRAPRLMMVSKSSRVSPVHRPAQMDTISITIFDDQGAVRGQCLLLGLFTSASYFKPAHGIPVLARKIARCRDHAGFAPTSHDGKALQHILDTFPRDELLQIDEAALFDVALGILHLQQRPRLALFMLADPFERFVTCLVYLPRNRYDLGIVGRMAAILAGALRGRVSADDVHLDESPLARIRIVIATTPGQVPPVNPSVLQDMLAEAARQWTDRLHDALTAAQGMEAADTSLQRFATAFPGFYTERYSAAEAVADIASVDAILAGSPIIARLAAGAERRLGLKLFHAGSPLALSDVLPMLENLGLRVVNEIPFEIRPRGAGSSVWLQDLELQATGAVSLDSVARFEEAFRAVWSGTVEDDGFNRLVLQAGLTAREAMVLRAYCKMLRQAGSMLSQAYMQDTLSAHPALAALLVRLFAAQFDPAMQGAGTPAATGSITAEILAALDHVDSPDEDRILRSFLTLISQTLRTNHYQRDAAGQQKPYLSLKLASAAIDLLPPPRPLVEVFVYSPAMEGCHLRGGRVARGGIRWSDRREDFRTEILGLMKAQMVKNAIIVPVGSKGGFVVKRAPTEGGREALMAEVVECYRTLMRGLLDITDSIDGDRVIPPSDVVRRDGDDPYLVVAADKGTATFSDIANGVARDYGFWLDDAFASGGSAGYDHKAMGITARGAWEAVKRHFRERGTDCQTTDFTCVGVGDMAGDVFGNGMLLSKHTRLIAAFNHAHIFIDPDPDAAASFAERERLFRLPRSTWKEYDPSVLSAGGAVYERGAKSITLSAEACARLGIAEPKLTPTALIQALLRQNVDLLWFGGIGTYVKSSAESQAEAGDRANDALRVNADTLRARVIGEGANLGMTQRGRIDYARRGGRLNTDAIDNSAGVDTSDHEVNIKIALTAMIAAGALPTAERDRFLASMTDAVAAHVLQDNYLQTQALSVAQAQGAQALDRQARLMRVLEQAGRLDRDIEFLPSDAALAEREAAGQALTRPELAVLLAYAKNATYDAVLGSDLPDDPAMAAELLAYFPGALQQRGASALAGHRLRREIIATQVTNAMINHMGPSFAADMREATGRDAGAIARAFVITRAVFDLPALWQAIADLDPLLIAATQTRLTLSVRASAEEAARWFLLSGLDLAIGPCLARFRDAIAAIGTGLEARLPADERATDAAMVADLIAAGAPASLARQVLRLDQLSTAMDIVQIHAEAGGAILDMVQLYFQVGSTLGLLALRRQARALPATTRWIALAADALIEEAYATQRLIVRQVAASGLGLNAWLESHAAPLARLKEILAEIERMKSPDLAMLTVAGRQLGRLALAA